jgi:hypothetical protein
LQKTSYPIANKGLNWPAKNLCRILVSGYFANEFFIQKARAISCFYSENEWRELATCALKSKNPASVRIPSEVHG